MVEPLRHRQTKGAETDMFDLQPPRHISTLPLDTPVGDSRGSFRAYSGHHDLAGPRQLMTRQRHTATIESHYDYGKTAAAGLNRGAAWMMRST